MCFVRFAGLPAPDAVFFLNLTAEQAAARGGYGEERYEKAHFQQEASACPPASGGGVSLGSPKPYVIVGAAAERCGLMRSRSSWPAGAAHFQQLEKGPLACQKVD